MITRCRKILIYPVCDLIFKIWGAVFWADANRNNAVKIILQFFHKVKLELQKEKQKKPYLKLTKNKWENLKDI